MIKFKSLKTRLLIAFGLLSLIISLFFIRLSSLLIETAEANAFQSMLIKEQERLMSLPEPSDQSLLQYTVLYKSISAVPNDILTAINNQRSGNFITKDGIHYVFRVFETNNSQNVLLMNVGSFTANKHLSQYKSLFLYSISIAALILCLLSSWYLAKLLSRPIELLTQQVEQKGITQTRRKQKVLDIGITYGLERNDEIGKLANALSNSYSKIEGLLLREQNFTRDVSHELRTPITVIKNMLAIHTPVFLDDSEYKVLQEATSDLEQTIEVLLALARQENLVFAELKILPVLEQTVLNLYYKHPEIDFAVDVEVDPKMKAYCNEVLFTLLSQNLVNNAFYHGDGKSMRIASTESTLVFENSVVSNLSSRAHRGLGHGQYLVHRIAEQMNWHVKIEKTDKAYRVIIEMT